MEQNKVAGQSRSIESLNLVKASETGFEFELKNSAGTGLGVYLTVRGDHSDAIRAASRREVNAFRERAFQASKNRETLPPDPIEDDEAKAIEGAVLRIISWRGLDEPCTPDNARLLCTVNPEVRAQVYAASAQSANFMTV